MSGCQRILEVGCGSGLFLEEIVRQLPGSSVMGIELSEWAVQQARQKNLPVEKMDLQALIDRHETFDAVCSFQVLEHVSQPRALLESLVTLLSPGGKLVLGVPNKDCFLKHQYNLLDLPPHHMTRWGDFTFMYLEKLLPLKLVRVSLEPLAKYHIKGYVSAYAQYWHAKFPLMQFLLSNRRVDDLSRMIEKTGWYRFLRGQTLYALFERL